ncbi:hypothetical protein V2J09_015476 [Rumex salicifolius]
MANPWGGSRVIGSWAAEAEAEDREQAAAAANNNNNKNSDLQSFPSLKEAATTKTKKKKMSLAEFYTGGSVSSRSEGLTPNEMLQLPTGPKERAPDDYSGNRIGGGFSNYGGRSSGPRDGGSDSSWGANRSRGGFDDDGRGQPRRGSDYDLQPSRADEASDWGAGKRPMQSPSIDSGRTNRYDSLGAGSRADESESWNLGKKPISAAPPVRSSTFGSGYRNSGMDSDRWKKNDEDRGRDIQSGRPRLVLDPPRGEGAVNEQPQPVSNKANPFGAARPREEVLAEKGFDWKKVDLEIEVKSAHSSRPSSAQSSRSESAGLGIPGPSVGAESVVKPRPKVNPFGDAKPREVVLQEKGKDWRKMDLELEHRAIDRPETEEEKALKAAIEDLKKDFEKEPQTDPSQESEADQESLLNLVQVKERELEILTKELDDKFRVSLKAVERPGSGAGRFGNFSDRPPSRPGSVDGSRNVDFGDRPRSRGTGDVWTRPGEDRRGSFHGTRERGFLGNNRNFDRVIYECEHRDVGDTRCYCTF